MGLESAASRSLVSSSSPKLPIISKSLSSTISCFFEVFVGALGLDFEVGPSNEYAAATSFKAVVRDFSDLGAAALELRLERDRVLWRIIVSKCYNQRYYLLVSACDRSLSRLAGLGASGSGG
jgi:hypothetical protein